MKKAKLIPLTIARAKWARGGYNGNAALLNKDGNMCCLGFACRAAGFSAKAIKGHGEPQDLRDASGQPTRVAKKLGALVVCNGQFVEDAISINDNDRISDKMREHKLKPILKRLGFAVKFTGPTRDD